MLPLSDSHPRVVEGNGSRGEDVRCGDVFLPAHYQSVRDSRQGVHRTGSVLLP